MTDHMESRPFIWFDFGGVLSPSVEDLFNQYHRKTGISPTQLHRAFAAVAAAMGHEPLAPIELALITEQDWGARLRAHLSATEPDLDLRRAQLEHFGAQWFAGVEANPAMVDAVHLYRSAGFGVGVLSNNVIEWAPHWLPIIEPAGPFDCVIDSSQVRLRKPDPRIFELAAATAGTIQRVNILIDDLAINCAAARASGWQAVEFGTNEQVLADLAELTGLSVESAPPTPLEGGRRW